MFNKELLNQIGEWLAGGCIMAAPFLASWFFYFVTGEPVRFGP